MDSSAPSTPQPDADGLLKGYRGAFRLFYQTKAPRSRKERGKWIGFLPSTLPGKTREALFDELVRNVLMDPESAASACDSGKLALAPLMAEPHRVALMLYCDVDKQDLLQPVVDRHAKALRRRCLKEGLLQPRDGFLSKWFYKTDAQTQKELDEGTHAGRKEHTQRLIIALLERENRLSQPTKSKGPR